MVAPKDAIRFMLENSAPTAQLEGLQSFQIHINGSMFIMVVDPGWTDTLPVSRKYDILSISRH